MAFVFPGKTVCPICDTVIREEQAIVSFPPFVGNELDPLFLFHDAAFHEECIERHPLHVLAREQVREMQAKLTPKNCRCAVCTYAIDNPDEYFTLVSSL